MKRKASIISCKDNTHKLISAFRNSNEYILEDIFEEYIEFNFLLDIDAIFIDGSYDTKIISKVEKFCLDNNKNMFIYPKSINLRKSNIKTIDDLCFLSLNPYKISKYNLFNKRLFDIIFSIIFIVLSFPLFIIVFLLIKIFDRGPVFYLQKRLTKNKKEFIIFKFRTMKVNAEKDTGAVLSSKGDPRLSKIGKILRNFRIDEIPQIFNVLIGDMSIVGPRPERYFFTNNYERQNEYYKYRFNVKAGVTGYAQIYARYDSSYKEKLDYDLYYISNYSFISDIKIILKTIKNIFLSSKARTYKSEKVKFRVKEYKEWKKET